MTANDHAADAGGDAVPVDGNASAHATTASSFFFGLKPNRVVELGAQIEI